MNLQWICAKMKHQHYDDLKINLIYQGQNEMDMRKLRCLLQKLCFRSNNSQGGFREMYIKWHEVPLLESVSFTSNPTVQNVFFYFYTTSPDSMLVFTHLHPRGIHMSGFLGEGVTLGNCLQ